MIAAAGVAAACLVGSGVAALPASAQVSGQTLYASATGTGDCSTSTNACSLSTALGEVTAGGTIDLVTPGAGADYDGNFTVATGTSTSPVTVQAGPGVTDPTLDANNNGTVLTIDSGAYVDLSGITITGGSGSGIYNTTGTVTVTDSTISGNSADLGGAGGGIFSGGGTVTVTDSTISGNTASDDAGGGIFSGGGTVTVTDSTITGNTASDGSGLFNNVGSVTVTDSTISGNTAAGAGLGGGIFNNDGSVSLEADLLATPGGAPSGGECVGSITDLGFNVSDDTSCGFASTSTSISNSSAAEHLGPLQNNGGPTQTIEPTVGNPAIGLIPNQTSGLCPTSDQRGVASVPEAPCDAGSVQVASQTISFTGPASGTIGGEATLSATGGGSGNPVVFSIDSSSGAGVCSVSGTDGSTVTFTGVGSCVIDANQAGNTDYLPAATVTFTVTVTDADLAVTTPANITTPATGADGATVDYTMPTATDEGATATVACTPPPGSTFPVGTTTVACRASSSDDTNSPVSTTFTVTVEGAAAQLSDLATAVQGVGPGKSLAGKVHVARSSLAAGNIAKTCSTLDAFINEVRAQAGKKIGSNQARQLVADAQRIQAVLSCQGDQQHGG